MTIDPISLEDRLFAQLRTVTVARLRAAQRGDSGLCVLLARQRAQCLGELEGDLRPRGRRVLSAA